MRLMLAGLIGWWQRARPPWTRVTPPPRGGGSRMRWDWHGRALADVCEVEALALQSARLEELRLAAVDGRIEADLALERHAWGDRRGDVAARAAQLEPAIGGGRYAWLIAVADRFRQPLAVRTVWNASSPALDTKTWTLLPGIALPVAGSPSAGPMVTPPGREHCAPASGAHLRCLRQDCEDGGDGLFRVGPFRCHGDVLAVGRA
jgi:transcriptional activator